VGRQWALDESKPERPKLKDKRNMPIPVSTEWILNFTSSASSGLRDTGRACIRATAVHEFSTHSASCMSSCVTMEATARAVPAPAGFSRYKPTKVGGY